MKNSAIFKKSKNFNLEYDKDVDILYLTRGNLTKDDSSEELGDDVVIWRNKKTKEVSGFTVLNFSKRTSKNTSRMNYPAAKLTGYPAESSSVNHSSSAKMRGILVQE